MGAVGVICCPLLGIVCCACSAGTKAHAKTITTAHCPIVLLLCISNLELEVKTN